MADLHLAPTRSTFRVDFREDGTLALSGSSYPENAVEFFAPLVDWLTRFLAGGPPPLTLDLQVEYMNTSTTKRLLDLLDLLDRHHRAGGRVQVQWRHDPADDDMREMGEDLADGLALPFAIVPRAERA